jgi:hypothetical protein
MKKKKELPKRNEYVIAMKKSRKGGPMANKKAKRKNGKNKQKELLDENY